MKLYPIHIAFKDISLFAVFIILSDKFDQMNFFVGLWTSFLMMRGILFFNLLCFTILYYGLKRFFLSNSTIKYLIIGLLLHLPTSIFWLTMMRNEVDQFPVILALIISGLISGTVYFMLNSRRLAQVLNRH